MRNRTLSNEELVSIQEYYERGHSWEEVSMKLCISGHYIDKAKLCGLLKGRTAREAANLPGARAKQSAARIAYIKEHPDKSPYLISHHSKGPSYPERYFAEVFTKEGILLDRYVRIGTYELDFADEQLKIDVEIDGNQHYSDSKVVESDKRRTSYLTALGWDIIRIRWSDYESLSKEKKHETILEIRGLIDSKRSVLPVGTVLMFPTGALRNGSNVCACGNKIGKSSIRCHACVVSDGLLAKAEKMKKRSSREASAQLRAKGRVCGCGSNKALVSKLCYLCRAASRIDKHTKIQWPPKEELETLVWEMSTSRLSKELGVSDTAIAKKCKILGIKKPARGYWAGKITSKPRTVTKAVLDGCKRRGEAARKVGPNGTAWCGVCKEFLSVDHFSKRASRWNGLSNICKLCRSKYRSPRMYRWALSMDSKLTFRHAHRIL